MTTNHEPGPSRPDWRRRMETLPARWKISGSVLTVLVGTLLGLIFDSIAIGLVFAILIATSFGWWGSRDTGTPAAGRTDPTGPAG